MFKNKKIVILIIILIALLVCLFIFLLKGDVILSAINNEGVMIKAEYQSLNGKLTEDGKEYPEVNIPSNNILRYADVSELVEIFENDENAAIYFGSAECLYCRSAIEVLCDAASDTELDVIYYLDVDKDIDYSSLIDKLREDFITEDNKILSPLVIFVVNGEVVSHNKGTLFSQEDPYQELDASQVEGLKEIYSYGIRDVLMY